MAREIENRVVGVLSGEVADIREARFAREERAGAASLPKV
jgi:hypothetical protein